MNSPLKTHGGKGAYAGKLARWIIAQLPPPESYTVYGEHYCGGASVALHFAPDRYEGKVEVVNDLNGLVSNFWQVLSHERGAELMKREVDLFPFSEELFDDACEFLDRPDWRSFGGGGFLSPATSPEVAAALAFLVVNRMSRQGNGKDFATLSTGRTRGGMCEQVSAFLSMVEGLPEVAQRVRRWFVFNRPAIDCARRADSARTVHYFDPPYHPSTRSSLGEYGDFEMSDEDHQELLAAINKLEGCWYLSGYNCDLYEEWRESGDYLRLEYAIPNAASSQATKPVMVECLWTNANQWFPANVGSGFRLTQ